MEVQKSLIFLATIGLVKTHTPSPYTQPRVQIME